MSRTTENPGLPLRRLLPALLILLALLIAPGCGHRGAPQPPIKIQPQGSRGLTANQHGNNLTLSWILPKENTDQSKLVGVSRVELFRYTESLKPLKEGEEAVEPTDFDVLDQVTQSFLAESPGDDMYGAGYGTGAMAGTDSGIGGQSGGRGSSSTGQLGQSGTSQSGRGDDRDGWADQQQQRAPRITPGFRGASGKFISARKFEKNAELVHELSGSQLQQEDISQRLYHTGPLPELDEEALELTRYHYAVRVMDTLGREGLFSDFLMVTPLEPPTAPTNLQAKSLQKSIDLTWDGPPVNPWVRIAREKELEDQSLAGDEPASGTPANQAAGAGEQPADTDGEEERQVTGPPEDAVVPGWIVQPPATFGPGSAVRLTALWPDPWPVGPRRAIPPYIAGYYVFRQKESVVGPAPVPMHGRPVIEKAYSSKLFAFGETYRFSVRTVMVTADGRVESVESLPVTVFTEDVYPPITPLNFTYVAAAGEVTLMWTPNGEPDLLGYNLYRHPGTADAAEGEPVRLNDEPLTQTRFKDSTVRPGNWYTYQVDAVDRAEPANRSEKSSALQVMAR